MFVHMRMFGFNYLGLLKNSASGVTILSPGIAEVKKRGMQQSQ